MKPIRNLRLVKISAVKVTMMYTSRTNIALEVTNPLPKKNLELGFSTSPCNHRFDEVEVPNNHDLETEINTKDTRLHVKGHICSRE